MSTPTPKPVLPKLFTVKEAAAILRISTSQIYALIHSRQITCYGLRPRTLAESDLLRYLESIKTPARCRF